MVYADAEACDRDEKDPPVGRGFGSYSCNQERNRKDEQNVGPHERSGDGGAGRGLRDSTWRPSYLLSWTGSDGTDVISRDVQIVDGKGRAQLRHRSCLAQSTARVYVILHSIAM